MVIKLHDLVAQKPGGPFFSPFCATARCALLAKGVDFETVEVTYDDLRFHWSPKLGVKKATAPIIELEDGTCIMDSVEIAKWLDKTYPDRTSLFLPEASLPVDVNSEEYQNAVAAYPAFDKLPGVQAMHEHLFALWAPPLTKTFVKETAEYWTSDERLGQGVYAKIASRTAEQDAESIERVKQTLIELSQTVFANGRQFLASPTTPGMEDVSLYGWYRTPRSVAASIAAQTFEASEAGEFPRWLERMKERFPLEEQCARDVKD
ncbi:hypothetical protein JCM10207_000952 [Rhodosporidiobolus poonsookiae]